jgi:outer membrane receptor protein involved in Fe transport
VSGVAGAQTVDTATIPRALIQSVDILTGGASAIYGADAVTGVVNFNLRRDYQGTEIATQVGISEKGDGRTFAVDGIWGRNFIDNRLNITVAGSYSRGEELKGGDREFSRDNNQASAGLTYQNPNRRFQLGRYNQRDSNFSRSASASLRGRIRSALPSDPDLAPSDFVPGADAHARRQALIDRAANSPAQAIARRPDFRDQLGIGPDRPGRLRHLQRRTRTPTASKTASSLSSASVTPACPALAGV